MIESKRISLDARLSMIAEMVGICENYMDIGCDHGRLGAFLLQNNYVKKAYLTDISADSLKKSQKLIKLIGLENRVEFYVIDGIPRKAEGVDCIVIAGMGGVLIGEILERGSESLGNARLILQPNVAQSKLRKTLTSLGYRIQDEKLAKDGKRYYTIIEAVPGEVTYSREELLIGPVLMQHKTNELLGFADFRIRVLNKAIEGARNGNDLKEIQALEEELMVWKTLIL